MNGLENYQKEERPWGSFERFTLNQQSTVKLVTVRAGERLSLQTHKWRDEYWRVVAGSGLVRSGADEREAQVGDSFFTTRGTEHRLSGGPNGITILEIAFGDFKEDDITRLDDKYGRTQV